MKKRELQHKLIVQRLAVVSQVTMSQEETVWCLPHALEQITEQRQLAKQCKLLYTYSQVSRRKF